MLIKILIASILSGVLYRLGGWEKGNSKFRDLGCPAVGVGLLLLLQPSSVNNLGWLTILLSFLLSFGALCTYRYGLPKPKDYTWHYYLHGFMCGLAGIPLIWADVPLWIVLARLTLCTVGMGLWSKLINHDITEEFGRGVIFIL